MEPGAGRAEPAGSCPVVPPHQSLRAAWDIKEPHGGSEKPETSPLVHDVGCMSCWGNFAVGWIDTAAGYQRIVDFRSPAETNRPRDRRRSINRWSESSSRRESFRRFLMNTNFIAEAIGAAKRRVGFYWDGVRSGRRSCEPRSPQGLVAKPGRPTSASAAPCKPRRPASCGKTIGG